MPTNILFLCPHGAAKSTASAALLRREADRLGLDLHIENAGTDPDAVVNPIVSERLEVDGLPAWPTPRTVSSDDLAKADLIINIGCEHGLLPTDKPMHEWNIPNFSDDRVVAFTAIESHIAGLAAGLAAGTSTA